jgi:hypothetical protein
MGVVDNLSWQFSSRMVPREEHAKAIAKAQNRDPEKFRTVSESAEHSHSFGVIDNDAGQTASYYALSGGRQREINALANTSGSRGVGSHVLEHVGRRATRLDAFAEPLERYYGARGCRTTSRMKFDPAYAPAHWRPEYGQIGALIPATAWLVENLPSPPIVSILRDYLPSIPAHESIGGPVFAPPNAGLEVPRNATTTSNATVHVGRNERRADFIEQVLSAIADVLWTIT